MDEKIKYYDTKKHKPLWKDYSDIGEIQIIGDEFENNISNKLKNTNILICHTGENFIKECWKEKDPKKSKIFFNALKKVDTQLILILISTDSEHVKNCYEKCVPNDLKGRTIPLMKDLNIDEMKEEEKEIVLNFINEVGKYIEENDINNISNIEIVKSLENFCDKELIDNILKVIDPETQNKIIEKNKDYYFKALCNFCYQLKKIVEGDKDIKKEIISYINNYEDFKNSIKKLIESEKLQKTIEKCKKNNVS